MQHQCSPQSRGRASRLCSVFVVVSHPQKWFGSQLCTTRSCCRRRACSTCRPIAVPINRLPSPLSFEKLIPQSERGMNQVKRCRQWAGSTPSLGQMCRYAGARRRSRLRSQCWSRHTPAQFVLPSMIRGRRKSASHLKQHLSIGALVPAQRLLCRDQATTSSQRPRQTR